MKKSCFLTAIAVTSLVAICSSALGQTWTRLPAANGPKTAGAPLLLQDGSVLVHQIDTINWFRLIPDNKGSYLNGSWKKAGNFPSDYGPRFFASAVLTDGRVVAIGGEYNFLSGVWTNLGAIYTPATDSWARLNPPSGWKNIGDAQCVMLPNGRLMLANPFDKRCAILDAKTLTWTETGTGKRDRNDEEGWTLLPEGTVLTVGAEAAPGTEKYIPSLGTWISAGNTPQSLCDAASEEIGPAVLMADGRVFAMGGTTHTAIYTQGKTQNDPGTWIAGPDFPLLGTVGLQMADAPACLLPSGNVLLSASPGVFANPAKFYEFDGTKYIAAPEPPNAATSSCWYGNMLMLPTGQVLFTDQSNDVEIYTPVGGPKDAWRPVVTNVSNVLFVGQTVTVSGKQLNGLSQCSYYGDDTTNATNYPLTKITNNATGHVFYCRTFNHSTMAVATGSAIVTTQVTIPKTIETGASTLQIVTNGIASAAIPVTVVLQTIPPDPVTMLEGAYSIGSKTDASDVDSAYFTVASTSIKSVGQVSSATATFALPAGASFSQLSLSFNGHIEVNGIAQITGYFYIWDYTTNGWHYISNTPMTNSDKTVEVTVSDASRYLSGGKVKAMFRTISPPRVGGSPATYLLKINKLGIAPG